MVWTCGTDRREWEFKADNGSRIRGKQTQRKTKENLHSWHRGNNKKNATGMTKLTKIVIGETEGNKLKQS